MAYSDMAALMADQTQTDRIDACIREQGAIFAGDGRADIASLGRAVVSGSYGDITAVRNAVCTGPSWNTIDDDQALLSAVQSVWPTVAAARYPQEA